MSPQNDFKTSRKAKGKEDLDPEMTHSSQEVSDPEAFSLRGATAAYVSSPFCDPKSSDWQKVTNKSSHQWAGLAFSTFGGSIFDGNHQDQRELNGLHRSSNKTPLPQNGHHQSTFWEPAQPKKNKRKAVIPIKRSYDTNGHHRSKNQKPDQLEKKRKRDVSPGKYFHIAEAPAKNKFGCAKCGNVYKWRKSLNKHFVNHSETDKDLSPRPPGMEILLQAKTHVYTEPRQCCSVDYHSQIVVKKSPDISNSDGMDEPDSIEEIQEINPTVGHHSYTLTTSSSLEKGKSKIEWIADKLSKKQLKHTHSENISNHLDENKNKYQCLYCPYTSHFCSDIQQHSMEHIQVKRFPCKHCPYSTKWNYDLRKHLVSCKKRIEQLPSCEKIIDNIDTTADLSKPTVLMTDVETPTAGNDTVLQAVSHFFATSSSTNERLPCRWCDTTSRNVVRYWHHAQTCHPQQLGQLILEEEDLEESSTIS